MTTELVVLRQFPETATGNQTNKLLSNLPSSGVAACANTGITHGNQSVLRLKFVKHRLPEVRHATTVRQLC